MQTCTTKHRQRKKDICRSIDKPVRKKGENVCRYVSETQSFMTFSCMTGYLDIRTRSYATITTYFIHVTTAHVLYERISCTNGHMYTLPTHLPMLLEVLSRPWSHFHEALKRVNIHKKTQVAHVRKNKLDRVITLWEKSIYSPCYVRTSQEFAQKRCRSSFILTS
jgi:hypothetical protein